MKRDFDLIAKPYRWLEYLTFGLALTRCRNHFLPALADRRRALIVGDGDGRFTARLLASNPQLEAQAVDLSPVMLALLTRRVAAAHPTARTRLRTHPADARTFVPTGPYDLVVTHFFLDCLTQHELDSFAFCLRPHLTPNALWLVSDFRIPAGFMRLPARFLVRSLYFGFRILTRLRTTGLPNHAAALASVGLICTAQHLSLGGLLTSQLWSRIINGDLHLHDPTGVISVHATTAAKASDPTPARPSARSRTRQPLASRA